MWTLFKAKKKATREPLSIFRLEIKDSTISLIDRAKQSLKRIKTLRHPSILKYIDSSENDKFICIVTEGIMPLIEYLETISSDFSEIQRHLFISYGLLNVAKGISFLNNDCQLNHNNINMHSIFVNTSGVWKIGGLDCICNVDETPPPLHQGLSEKYNPPERLDPAKARHPGGKFAVDSWGFGCLVWECFNRALTPSSNVKTVGKMPKALSIHYNKLVQTSPKHRVSPLDFINNCKEAGVLFSSIPLQTLLSLEEIQLVKDPDEKTKIFNILEKEIDSFPPDICKNKILPDLINAFEYGEAGSAILNPIFKIGKMLNEDEYRSKLVPCIIKLYQCKDRAMRSMLLQQIDSYINLLTTNVINDQIFPQIVQGFMDSNFTIREQTVKSMLHIAPKLTQINLNEELMKHLTRLQTRDENGGIRANTTICLGKIAANLNDETRSKILLPSFLGAMQDQFPPARHAAIAAVTANEKVFSDKDCASKIMPMLCQLFIDQDLNVKCLALKSMKLFIERFVAQCEKDSLNEKKAPVSINEVKKIDQKTRNISSHSETNSKEVAQDMMSLAIKED